MSAARPRREPIWLVRIAVDAIHFDQLREHGGLPGLRDEGALESALERPRNKWAYDEEADLATLAAAYGFALVKSHPYGDGNKRVGFLAMVTFLGLNGHALDVTDEEIVTMMLGLAAGHVSEEELAAWVKEHSRPESE